MKERPILFSGPMVRAILEGRKTQTRRAVKGVEGMEFWRCFDRQQGDRWAFRSEITSHEVACPYGAAGDRLWVRESWNVSGLGFGMKPSLASTIADAGAWRYAADDKSGWQHGWRPSIHMPRGASRITLEVMGVRVERLQEISEADAVAEGIERDPMLQRTFAVYPLNEERPGYVNCPLASYHSLWDSINGPGSWDANPWVWVVEFRRVEKEAA